jgi:hypothetical protein
MLLTPTSFTKCKKIDARVGGESKEEGRSKGLYVFHKACHENKTSP